MGNIRWVIQNNLIAEKDRVNMFSILDDLGIEYQEVLVVPFSKELPDFTIDDKTNIYYGSTTFMNNIYEQLDKPVGLFYNHETFSMENYFNQYGEHMLNHGADVLTIKDAIRKYGENEDDLFFRPDGDGKEFDGQTMSGVDMCGVLARALKNDERLSDDQMMVVSKPWGIRKEWRNYIVNGKVVASSRYLEDFRLSKSGTDIPEDMIKFTEDMCKLYQPHDVFAMDVALTGGEYYIIECGCMNSVGFYDCDVREYIKAISTYVESETPTKGTYEEHIMSGDELIDGGCTNDAFGNKLLSFTKYNVTFNHEKGSYTVLSENAKYHKTKLMQYLAIQMLGGLVEWVNYGIEQGVEAASNSEIMLWEYNFLMNYFADRDCFEEAQYLHDELGKYEEYLKTSG